MRAEVDGATQVESNERAMLLVIEGRKCAAPKEVTQLNEHAGLARGEATEIAQISHQERDVADARL